MSVDKAVPIPAAESVCTTFSYHSHIATNNKDFVQKYQSMLLDGRSDLWWRCNNTQSTTHVVVDSFFFSSVAVKPDKPSPHTHGY